MTWRTVPICALCWKKANPGCEPVRVIINDDRAFVEFCFDCGHTTQSGIYVRRELRVNSNRQMLVTKTKKNSPNHPFALIWHAECSDCGYVYEVNSCDFHDRRCYCQGGKPAVGVV